MQRWRFRARRPKGREVLGATGLLSGALVASALVACGPSALDQPGTGGDAAVDATAPATCEQVQPIRVSPSEPPDLLFVVDKSQSMDGVLLTSDEHKWHTMRDALSQVATEFDRSIHMGLSLYPRGAACEGGIVNVSIASGSGSSIREKLTSTRAVGATPTHLTLRSALAHFDSLPVNPAGRYVLLATDGVPNCGYDSALGRNTSGKSSSAESVAAIEALRAADIVTFVVGFDGDAIPDDSALVAMATAAGTGPYIEANSAAELRAAFLSITNGIGADVCTLSLDAVPEDSDRLAVSLDGVPIPRTPSHLDGWDYDALTNAVTFYGSACVDLRSGSVSAAHVDYGCPGPIVD